MIETTALNQAERSEYCRQHGLYPEQLDAWQAMFESLDAVPVSCLVSLRARIGVGVVAKT